MNITQFPSSHNFIQSILTTQSNKFQSTNKWQSLTDQELQAYQNSLIYITQGMDILSQIHKRQKQNEANNKIELQIQSLRFKDLFFDFIEGQNHKLCYLGKSTQKQQEVNLQTIKLFASILFKIGQQEKIFYPHLLTHIKEQFYRPNLFDKEHLKEDTKQNYSILIDIFFNQAHQTSSYDDFIKLNPDFQDICIIVLKKIAHEQTKRIDLSSSNHQPVQIKSKVLQMIQKFCSKFLIEINYFSYEKPSIQMIALANEQRFIFINESSHVLLLTLQKFQLLTVRRKSSHNISVQDKCEKDLKRSSHNQKQKKNSWNQLQGTAHFRTGQPSEHMRDFLVLNVIDSDQTSNYESSILKSESKVNELSDQSTPKFKNSSIAHVRKKSHKDSFGGVDFDNMVYKDLSNPKRYVDQKGNRQKQHGKKSNLNVQVFNKKVLSERFQTHELESLTYGDDEDSSIQFVPHFHMNEGNENGKNVSMFGNDPASPAYSNNNFGNFSSFPKFEFDQNKAKMVKKMKGSNIQKSNEFFYNQDQNLEHTPKFKHQNSNGSQGNLLKTYHNGSRLLASSEIIQFTGSFENNPLNSQIKDDDQHMDFLIIPSLKSQLNLITQKQKQLQSSVAYPQKDVFMSFSKNDKEKFIVHDSNEMDGQPKQTVLTLKIKPIQSSIHHQQQLSHEIQENQNNVRTRKYSYRTQKQQRDKFRKNQKLQQQIQFSQTCNSFISQNTPASGNKKPKYKKYHEVKTSQSIIFHQYDSASEINLKNSHTFTHKQFQNNNNFRLQRKHSSNIPVYKAVETPQENNLVRSRHPADINYNNKNSKRFEQNSVRFSQVIENNHDEIFYVKEKQRDERRQSFGTKKQRKVTDFYQSPLVNLNKGGNRASQIIQNGLSPNKNHQNVEHRFQGHLDVSHDNSSLLINSGGGKNYSVISNISYDEQKRIQDLIEIQNHQTLKKVGNNQTNYLNNNEYANFVQHQTDFANIQAIERLIARKKQQKNKLNSCQLSVSIFPRQTHLIQPENWVKKQIFYFFETNLTADRVPQKHVIFNPKKQSNNLIVDTNRGYSRSNDRIQDFPSSSTSLYNFKSGRLYNPEFEGQKDNSLSNKSLGGRKYSIKDLKPVSEINFSPIPQIHIHKLNSSPLMNNQNTNKFLNTQQKKKSLDEFDKISTCTQPLPRNNIRFSPVNRNQAYTPYQPQIITPQNLKNYPSQPIIRFTVGNSPAKTFIQPPISQSFSNFAPTPLMNTYSQQNLQNYHRIQ